jgi:hypothetical protein
MTRHAKIKSSYFNSNSNFTIYFVALFDYLWVITIYVSCAFILATIIDGHILTKYDSEKTHNEKSWVLSLQILIQMALQGFIVILIILLLQKLPSPMNGVFGYSSKGPLGILVRNPTLIPVLLFSLSKTLQARLLTLYSRVNKNAWASAIKV